MKRLTPALSNLVLARPGSRRAVRLLEVYLAILQGRGAASAWSREGEADVVARSIHAPHPVIIDVGAAIGDWSRLTSRRLGRAASYFLVEPARTNWPILENLNLDGEVHVCRSACGLEVGTGQLRSHLPGVGSASLYDRRDSFLASLEATVEDVPVTTVAALAEQYELELIDFLKVDVEGAEMDVLLGAAPLLEDRRVKALSFEFGSGQVNSRSYFRDFWDLLTGHGFRLACIAPGGKVLPIDRYDEEHEHYRGVTNYLGVLK